MPDMKWPSIGTPPSGPSGLRTSFLLENKTDGRFSGEYCALVTHLLHGARREREIAHDLRIRIREFQRAHPRSSIGQQTRACFQNAKKERGVDILQASKSRVAQPCRGGAGSHEHGSLPRGVFGLPPPIPSYIPPPPPQYRER